MAKVSYIPGDTEQFGYTFRDGKSVDVTDVRHLAKFKGNRFFKVEEEKTKDEAPTGLHAKHKGRGKWSIFDGDKELKADLSKEDAEAFNALSADEKAEYVK
jgi:hypothetical protein